MNANKPVTSKSFFATELTKRHFLTHRRLFLLILVLILSASGWALAQSLAGEAAESQSVSPPLAVETVRLKPVSSFGQQFSYTGLIAARRTSDLSFERQMGKLTALLVDEGDSVKAGQKLAQLDVRELAAKKKQLVARHQQALAVLQELIEGPRAETIAAAAAEVEALKTQVERLQKEHQRNLTLLPKQAVSQKEIDDSFFGLHTTKAKLEAARHQWSELKNGTRKEKIDAQKALAASLAASIEAVDIDIADSTLVAPFDGKISKRFVDEGTIISPHAPIVRLVENHRLEARIGVPAAAAAKLQAGKLQPVVVGDKTFSGEIQAVLPELDKVTRTRTVIISLDERAAAELVPNQVVRISLNKKVNSSGFWLPTSALARSTHGLWAVYAVTLEDSSASGAVQRRDVEVLYTQGNRVFVRGTISAGETVVASGVHRLVPGQKVQVKG